MLLVFAPLSFIDRSVKVSVDSFAVGFVVFPLTLVDIAIRVNQTTDAISFVIAPLTFIQRSIRPDLLAQPCSERQVRCPLTNVDRPVCQPVRFFLYEFGICVRVNS